MHDISHMDAWNPDEVASLTQRLQTHVVGRHIHLYDSVTSTNDIALRLAHDRRSDGAVVLAETQTRGRGRRRRAWHSPRGGLWMSVVFCPHRWPAQPSLLALLSAAPTAMAIEDSTGLNVKIKWPNDLCFNGRKVGGILGEIPPAPTGPSLVIGFGLNVNIPLSEFPTSIRSSLTSLLASLPAPANRMHLLERLLVLLDECYQDFLSGATDLWFNEYHERCESLGATITVRTSHGELTGEALALDCSGALQIRTQNGTMRRILTGDVF